MARTPVTAHQADPLPDPIAAITASNVKDSSPRTIWRRLTVTFLVRCSTGQSRESELDRPSANWCSATGATPPQAQAGASAAPGLRPRLNLSPDPSGSGGGRPEMSTGLPIGERKP